MKMAKCESNIDRDEIGQLTATVEIEVSQSMVEEARRAAECGSVEDDFASVRDQLLDCVEVSPVFLVDGVPIGDGERTN